MPRLATILLPVLLLAAPALAQGSQAPAVPAPPSELRPAGDQEKRYVAKVALLDNFELEAARIALRRAKAQPVKAYAQLMLDHYEGAMDRLRVAAGAVNAPVPTVLADEQKALLAALRDAPEQEFDRRYMEGQVAAHQEALALHRGYGGDSVVLRQHAERHATLAEQYVMAARQVMSQVSGA